MKTKEEILKEHNIDPDGLDNIINYVGHARLLKAMESYAKEYADEKCKNCITDTENLVFRPKSSTRYVISGKIKDRSHEINFNDEET